MKNYRFYIYTLVTLIVFSVTASFIGVSYLSKSSTIQLLDAEIQSAAQQTKDIARMAEGAFKNNVAKDSIAESIQKALNKTNTQTVFLTVFDWSGKFKSHPDVTQKNSLNQDEGMKSGLEKVPSGEELYDFIELSKGTSVKSDIFYTAPIEGLGWIIAAHINIDHVESATKDWKNQAY